jgi:hypothetical protein
MIRKVALLAAGAAGYVLGSKAGRGRYEQIKSQTDKLWNDPKVQQFASDAQDFAAEKAPVVKEKVGAAAGTVASKAKSATQDATAKIPKPGTSGGADTDEEALPGTVENPFNPRSDA